MDLDKPVKQTTDDQRAAGFITAACVNGQVKFLVLQSSVHYTWTCPKGYIEPDEDLMDCARREFLEETGCAVDNLGCKIIPGKQYLSEYAAWGGHKRVAWFLLMCTDDKQLPTKLSWEHIAYNWVTFTEYQALQPTFLSMHKVLAAAQDDVIEYIRSNQWPRLKACRKLQSNSFSRE